MHPSKLILAPAVLALAVVAVACSLTDPIAADSPTLTTVSSTPRIEPSAGVPEVLDFSAPSLGGGAVNGSDYAGKDLAIWFWAPW